MKLCLRHVRLFEQILSQRRGTMTPRELARVPEERQAPKGWTATMTLADVASFFEIVVRTRLEATVVAQFQKR
jgi:hypothetical protein